MEDDNNIYIKNKLTDEYKKKKELERQERVFEGKRRQANTPAIQQGAGMMDKPDMMRVKGTTDKLNQASDKMTTSNIGDWMAKTQGARKGALPTEEIDYSKFKGLKKMLGRGAKALPGVGALAGVALGMDSDNAAASLPMLDQAESVGMSGQEEDMALAEDQALRNYEQSQASQDAQRNMTDEEREMRRQALSKLRGF